MALYVKEGSRSFRQSKLECSCHESCVFRTCNSINNYYVYAVYRYPGHDGSLYDCFLDSMARVQSVHDKAVFVFVSDANAHHSEWLESVSPTDRHGRDALAFCNLSGCEQLERCPTYIAGNRLDLVMADVPDIVDMVVGTPLGTSDYFFVSCALRVKQFVPEYCVRSTVFLKHRTNWDSVCSAIRSLTWSTILRSTDPLVAFDRAIREVIGRYVPTPVLRCRSGDKKWFDASCRRVYDAKQTAYRAWCRARNTEHGVNLCLLVRRPRGSMVLHESFIMSAPRILSNTRPVHVSGGID